MVSTLLLGYEAARSPKALKTMRERVSNDESWQVQEMLAQTFNQYCQDTGYEKALPTIKGWLTDKNPNARRAVTEGLRIWSRREYFKEHPDVAVGLLAALKGDESKYVRRSVGTRFGTFPGARKPWSRRSSPPGTGRTSSPRSPTAWRTNSSSSRYRP